MKQNLRFSSVFLKNGTAAHSPCVYKIFCLTFSLLILFASSASAQLMQQWQTLATTEGSTSQLFSGSVLDADGNIYMLGSQESPGGESTLTLMKYDANGQKAWHKKMENFPNSTREFPVTLKVDSKGDVYLMAVFTSTYGGQAMAFAKVSSAGETLWIRPYQNKFASIDRAHDFMITENDEVYVAGYSSYTTGKDIFALKLSASGEVIWNSQLNGMISHSTYGAALALDTEGNPLLAFRGRVLSKDTTPVSYLVKLNKLNGIPLSTTPASEPETEDTVLDPRQVYVDADGMIYTISQNRSGYQYTILLTKADAAGNIIWSKVEDFDGAGSVVMWHMRVDAEDNLILSSSQRDAFTMKYSKEGKRVWFKSYTAGAATEASVSAIDINANGHIAVAGSYYNTTTKAPRSLLLLYDQQGELIFEEKFESVEPTFMDGGSVQFDANGNLYLSGVGAEEGKSKLFAMKYSAQAANCDTPVAVKLILPPGGQQVGKPVSTTAMLEADKLPADVSARWNWGDGASSIAYHTTGTNQVTGQHTYSSTGVYLPQLEFTDACLESTGPENAQPLAIYDPNAGFVTGGGWFTPASIPEQVKVQFDFNIRYKEQGGENLQLTGTTSFKLSNALRFESTSHDWLVVQEDKAVWQGAGQINGRGNFGFTVSVVDAGQGKKNGTDKLRLRIWDKHEGNKLYYDSHATDEFAYFLTENGPAIGGGNIVIHRNGNLYAEKKNGVDAQDMLTNVLTAYPNPFAGTSMLRFELQEQSSYTLALYDMKGVLVQELRQGNAQGGELVEVQVDASALPKGMYLARLVTDRETRSVKLIVQQ